MKYEKPELIEITARARGNAFIDACSLGSAADSSCVEGESVTACTGGGTPIVVECTTGGGFV